MSVDGFIKSDPIFGDGEEHSTLDISKHSLTMFYDIRGRKLRQFDRPYDRSRSNGKILKRRPIHPKTKVLRVCGNVHTHTNHYEVQCLSEDGNILNTNYH